MIKTYTRIFWAYDIKKRGMSNTEPLNLKLNEGLDAIQERGGTIINSSLVSAGQINKYIYHIVYEDNGNFEEINSYLRDTVFDFAEMKMYDL